MKISSKILALAAASFLASNANAETIYGVTVFRDLVTFDSANPGTILTTKPITGLTSQDQFESVRKIDFRPATGQLYAVGNAPGGIYRLYTIDINDGKATRIGGNQLLNPISGSFGFSFEPGRDQIRIVTDDDQNLRYNPATAALVSTDTPLRYGDGDANFGVNPTIVTASATAFNVWSIDRGLGTFANTSPAELDQGLLRTDSATGLSLPNYIDGVSLEISPDTLNFYVALSDPGTGQTNLYKFSGGPILLGEVGSGLILHGIAIPPPAAQALPQIAFISKTGPSLPGASIRLIASTDPGLKVRIQSSTNPGDEGSWTDLPTPNQGQMTENDPSFPGAGNYTLATAEYPHGAAIYFRAISAKEGFSDGKSDPLGPFDLTVPEPPQHGGLSQTIFTVNEKSTPPADDLSDTVLRFAAIQTGFPKGLRVRVQKNVTDPNNEAGWSDLENRRQGHMLRDVAGHQFVLNSTDYPLQQGAYFRAISSAQSYPDTISNFVGPFSLGNAPHLKPTTFLGIGNSHIGSDLLFLAHEGVVGSFGDFGVMRVQSSRTPADEQSWTDLNPPEMHAVFNFELFEVDFILLVNNPPVGQGLYFRAVGGGSGYVDSISNACGPFSIVSDIPPVVTTNPPTAASNSKTTADAANGDGHDPENPIILPVGVISFSGSAQSSRAIKTLKLQIDGNTVAEFPGQSAGAVSLPVMAGDHVLETVAIDDLGARTRAGTGPVFIRVQPSGASGKTFRVAKDNGFWNNETTWIDQNDKEGIPGRNDFAIIGGSTIQFATGAGGGEARAVSINGGGLSGATFLRIYGQLTVFAATVEGPMVLEIQPGAVCQLLNATHIEFNPLGSFGRGAILNYGTVNVHGSGGIVGTERFINYGWVNWQTPISVPPAAQTNPLALLRPMPVTNNVGNFTSHYVPRLIGQDGASLIGQDGASLISEKGGAIISDAGTGLIGQDGASFITDDGAGFLSDDGAGVLTHNGGNLIGTGVGSFKPTLQSDRPVSRRSSTANEDVFTFTQDAGETNLEGIGIMGNVVINGGSLTGSGVIAGHVTNKSFIVPGHSAGTISILGDFTQEAQGTLVIENGGAKPAEYDQIQVGGVATLNGKLQVRTINGYVPDAADTFNPLGYKSVSGTFASVSGNTQLSFNASGALATVNPSVANPPLPKALNISTRMRVEAGDDALFGGFIITGSAPKKVIIRALGPSTGVPGALADTTLELHKADGSIVFNNDWRDNQEAEILATIPPTNNLEAAIVATLPPGQHTAIVRGNGGSTGVGLIEVYDLEGAAPETLANISTRGKVQTDDDVMIGGFIIDGNQPARILVRVIGPSLTALHIAGALEDPVLELHNPNGATLNNDDWRSTQEAEIIATRLAPTNNKEAAILATLVPGPYTVIVRGANDTTGIAVIEAYNFQ